MKKLLVLVLFSASVVFSQNEQPNIELPDFIITGRQTVEIPAAIKPKTELISILSKDFFTPKFSSEELPYLITSTPAAVYPSVKEAEKYFNGNVKIMLGKETMPFGLLNFSQSFDYYLFNIKAWGTNINEYKPYAGYNNSGVELTNDFSISTRSSFLPGTKVLAEAKYYRDSYYLFGSTKPEQLRKKNNGNAAISISSMYSKIFNFAFGASGNIFSLNESNLKETNLTAFGRINFRWSNFKFGGNTEIKRQMLSNNLSRKASYDYLSSEAFVEFIPFRGLWVNGGIYFSTNSVNNMFSPFAAAEFLLDKGLVLGAEFKPRVEFLNMENILDKNLYAALGLTDNMFTKYNNDLTIAVRYEFQKLFSVSLSANYSKIDNYLYYEDLLNVGMFDIRTANDVQILKSTLKIYLQPTKFGSLFADAVIQRVSNADDKAIPYEPNFTSSLAYNYSFNNACGFGLKYKIAFGAYTDLKNAQKIDNYSDISASGWYELFSGFKLTIDFQNILNRSNFAWKQYQEKPFDYLIGFEYRW
ncbi:MAG: TonB-dependent receptor [Bacteroidota bacterium]